MNKIVTSVKVPAAIELEMSKKIIADGYGMRGKSRWITEAVEGFLRLSDYPELVNIADAMEGLDKIISVRLSADLMKRIDHALISVRKQYPEMEGVKSNILRASIMQRMLRT